MSRQTLVCKHPLAFVKFQTEEKENFKNCLLPIKTYNLKKHQFKKIQKLS